MSSITTYQDNIVCYSKHKKYILTIMIKYKNDEGDQTKQYNNNFYKLLTNENVEFVDYVHYNINTNDDDHLKYAAYVTHKFKIISIEDVTGNTYDSIEEFTHKDNKIKYEINKEYIHDIIFYITKEQAFNINFIKDKQYLLFQNGYSGLYTEYYNNGILKYKVYHINGEYEGEFIKYTDEEEFLARGYYISGKKHGDFKVKNNKIGDSFEVFTFLDDKPIKYLYVHINNELDRNTNQQISLDDIHREKFALTNTNMYIKFCDFADKYEKLYNFLFHFEELKMNIFV